MTIKTAFIRISVVVVVCLATSGIGAAQTPRSDLTVLLVVGAPGEAEYQERFAEMVTTWQTAAAKGGVDLVTIGVDASDRDRISDRQRLQQWLEQEAQRKDAGEVWLVLIGHGSFDGRTVKFGLTGPDFTDQELAGWLTDWKRPLAVINTASASSPFLSALSGKDRLLISATKSASEIFYTRFGEYFSRAIAGIEGADLDNDEQVSLLEAFLYAAAEVANFYESEGRLATEHALIDDNGDGLGTRPDWFEGVRAVRKAREGAEPDGDRALQRVLIPNAAEARMAPELRRQRDSLELELKALRRQRDELSDADYYRRIEALLLKIAKLYRQAEGSGS